MAITETLTVRLEADSSNLQGELEHVEQALRTLQQSMSAVSQAASSATSRINQFGTTANSVHSVTRAVSQLGQQIQQVSRTPLSLNVSPALQALGRVSQMISVIASQLAALQMLGAAPAWGGGGGGGELTGSPRMLARGGLVTGPGGVDRVPALLTAGEFVLRKAAVQELGVAFLQALNAQPGGMPTPSANRRPAPGPGEALPTHPMTTNVQIEIRDATQLGQVLDELSRSESALRLRRG